MNEITEGNFPEVRSRQEMYLQDIIKSEKLRKMLVKWDAGTLDFKPTCTKQLLMEQERYMREYIRCLETRAEVEGVDL